MPVLILSPQTVFEAFHDADLEPYSYSGRAMYGRQCIAITVDDTFSGIALVLEVLADAGEDTGGIVDLISNTRQDSMGLSVVLYWPDLEWSTEFDEEEEEE